jgi:MoaA/NifB/PqqE/SkfB family radical SAM enzyme
MTPFVNTNAYLLTREHVLAFNDAGLYGMQISIDNVRPNAETKKSLKVILPKLRLLSEHARFRVRINSVLGSGPPEEAIEVTHTAVAFGFDTNCSLVRDGSGAAKALDQGARRAYETIRGMGKRLPFFLDDDYTIPLLRDGHVDWKCRAGARTFYVCEKGLVHLCGARIGSPGTPLADYTTDDIARAFHAPKPCAPTCPVAYAHQASKLDRWRAQPGDLSPI